MTSRILVDGANVVGSRPDGWWKDRAGAAARLQRRLVAATLETDRIVLVLEGQARRGVHEGLDGAVETVHAPHDGDSLIATLAARAVADGSTVQVVTADRGLIALVTAAGAEVRGPGWLLEQLPS